ncbi:ComEA family DNA-binding protein [Parabacteroides sp.]
MKWRDLLYFSKGERQALTLLLSLIAMAWIAIILTDFSRTKVLPDKPVTDNMKQDTSLPIAPNGNPPNPTRKENKFHSKENEVSSERKSKRIRKEFEPRPARYPKTDKFPAGPLVELNSAATTALQHVPGLGSVFAKRIIKYRELLGGFYSVEQLGEVYGIDEERYESMKSWFSVELSAISQLPVNQLSVKELASHPYVSYKQARVIERQVRKKGKLQGWENLTLLEEFTEYDRERLRHYFSFQ